jgi:hypothetical protein
VLAESENDWATFGLVGPQWRATVSTPEGQRIAALARPNHSSNKFFLGGRSFSRELIMRKPNFPNISTLALFVLLTLSFLTQLPTSAAAQPTAFPPARVVNVAVNFSTQVPLPDLSEAAVEASQKSSRIALYRLARDECAVMKTVIAEACQLTNMNISTQIQNYNNQNPVTLYVNGNANFTISLKDGAAE